MTIYPDYLMVCPQCKKAVLNDPKVHEDVDRCPYCGIDMEEARKFVAEGKWEYDWA